MVSARKREREKKKKRNTSKFVVAGSNNWNEREGIGSTGMNGEGKKPNDVKILIFCI